MSAAAALVEYNRRKERLTAAFDGPAGCARRS
jgi:hypothetical protein